jgi:hypothetical protein
MAIEIMELFTTPFQLSDRNECEFDLAFGEKALDQASYHKSLI